MDLLQHIELVTSSEEVSNNPIYTLKMYFPEDNDFFTHEVLELSLEYETDIWVKTIKATTIQWKKDKDPSKKKMKKKNKVKIVDVQSFFAIFTNYEAPANSKEITEVTD